MALLQFFEHLVCEMVVVEQLFEASKILCDDIGVNSLFDQVDHCYNDNVVADRLTAKSSEPTGDSTIVA